MIDGIIKLAEQKNIADGAVSQCFGACKSINYDASHISRIRSGQRQPADPQKFAMDVSRFIVRRYTNENEQAIIAELIGCSAKDITDNSVYYEKLTEWLTSGVSAVTDYTFEFLKKAGRL